VPRGRITRPRWDSNSPVSFETANPPVKRFRFCQTATGKPTPVFRTATAACTRSERFGAAILLNSNNARWRRNFDLAHELFHLLTWDIFRVGDQLQVPTDPEAKFANRFAGRLLMPPEALELAIGKQRRGKLQLDFDDLFEVARQFDVSLQSLLYQMSDAKWMNRDKVPAALEALRPKLEFWDRSQGDSPHVRPLRYEALAREAIEKGSISTGKFAQYMGLSRTAAMSVIASEIRTRPEQEADAQVEVFDS